MVWVIVRDIEKNNHRMAGIVSASRLLPVGDDGGK
jgi:hypothetical protein